MGCFRFYSWVGQDDMGTVSDSLHGLVKMWTVSDSVHDLVKMTEIVLDCVHALVKMMQDLQIVFMGR